MGVSYKGRNSMMSSKPWESPRFGTFLKDRWTSSSASVGTEQDQRSWILPHQRSGSAVCSLPAFIIHHHSNVKQKRTRSIVKIQGHCPYENLHPEYHYLPIILHFSSKYRSTATQSLTKIICIAVTLNSLVIRLIFDPHSSLKLATTNRDS